MDRLEVARFSTLPEAELAVALLRRQGVDARLADREMANSAPHLQLALGGLRVTAPDFQIVQARDVVARARRGEFGDLQSEENDEWMADATPGMVGELHESEVRGVMGSMKNIGRLLIIGFLTLPVAGCLVTVLFAEA
ncbi:MAG TPA: hypothetical protein VLZ51_11270 [Brevundimonas sp.]|nr:hypothetical protein [Brevundimonas sp.]